MSNNSSMGHMTDPHTPATDYSEVPETKSLLPPLPDTILKPSVIMVQGSTDTELDDLKTSPRYSAFPSVLSTPPRRSTSRFPTINTSTPSTPRQMVTPSSGTHYTTPRSAVMSPGSSFEHHNGTPTHLQNTPTRNTHATSSPFSPVIPIDERFGVSLAEPDTVNEPASPMEKLRHFEMCQKTQDAEFQKTCESLKQSGWMSQKEILQLERAKEENWRRWEMKVKAARREVSLSRENGTNPFILGKTLNYHQANTTDQSPTRRGEKLDGLGISSK